MNKETLNHEVPGGLEYYGTGTVAEDIVFKDGLHSVILKVIPIEKTYVFDGDLSEQRQVIDQDVVDSRGVVSRTKVIKNNYITAIWYPAFNSNRSSPPDVRKGHTVQLYHQKNKDIFYWSDMFFEPNLKTYEHVDFMYKNYAYQEPNEEDYDESKFYRGWISTILKCFGFASTKSDGERKRISVNFNLKYSYFRLTERISQLKGNIFQMDFENGRGLWTTRKSLYAATSEEINLYVDPELETLDMDSDNGPTGNRHNRIEAGDHRVEDGKKITDNCCGFGGNDGTLGSGIKITKDDIRGHAWSSIQWKACVDFTAVSPNAFIDSHNARVMAEQSVVIQGRAGYKSPNMSCGGGSGAGGGGSIVIERFVDINGVEKVRINAPVIELNGTVVIGGDLNVGGVVTAGLFVGPFDGYDGGGGGDLNPEFGN